MLSFRLVRNLSENKERSPTSEDDRLGYSVAGLIIQMVCYSFSLYMRRHLYVKIDEIYWNSVAFNLLYSLKVKAI